MLVAFLVPDCQMTQDSNIRSDKSHLYWFRPVKPWKSITVPSKIFKYSSIYSSTLWKHNPCCLATQKNLLRKGNYCAELESWICSAEFFSRARESGCDIAHKQCPAILSTSAELPINMWHIQINSSVMSSWILIWFQKQLKSYCEHLSMYQAVDEVTASLGAVLLHSV